MKLRWFTYYDKNGVDSEKELQWWSDSLNEWTNIEHIRVAEHEVHDATKDERLY